MESIITNKLIDNTIKELSILQYRYDIKSVFCDCIEYTALLLNRPQRQNQLETMDKFKYKYRDDMKTIKSILDNITTLLSNIYNTPDDYLGKLYMRVIDEFAKTDKGQYFTPYEVSQLMSRINIAGMDLSKKHITVNDPCCGSGGLLIAFIEEMKNRDINYLKQFTFYANDIDKTCVYMTFLQLSFVGAAAVVEHKDTLTQQTYDRISTVGYFLQNEMLDVAEQS